VRTGVQLSTDVDFVEEFVGAAERLAVTVAWADLRAPVRTCPGWTVHDLVVHVGNVHAWAATIVETGRAAAEQNDEPSSGKGRAVSAWYAGKAEDLYEVLRASDPDAPCWNFAFGSGTKRFWPRRQLHETTVHGLDLDHAIGRASAVTPAIARDGIDEVLRVFLHRMHRGGHAAALDRPVAVAATDTGDTWVVAPRPAPGSTPMVPAQPIGTAAETVPPLPPTVEHRRTPSVVAVADRVEAPADVLYRLLWKRVGVDEADVRLVGDEDRVRAFLGSRLVP
jgi:uncharacterized protein (TIGR03083 family)